MGSSKSAAQQFLQRLKRRWLQVYLKAFARDSRNPLFSNVPWDPFLWFADESCWGQGGWGAELETFTSQLKRLVLFGNNLEDICVCTSSHPLFVWLVRRNEVRFAVNLDGVSIAHFNFFSFSILGAIFGTVLVDVVTCLLPGWAQGWAIFFSGQWVSLLVGWVVFS